jgi:hypothetical protein
MQQMSSCPKCRALLPHDTKICDYCGYTLSVATDLLDQTLVLNTSGQGKTALIPPEIRGWNWGAFFLAPLWGIFNRVWISLLAFIPIPFLALIMSIVLGVKGNEWAWRSRRWDSIEHFNRIQKHWMYWGIIAFLVSLVVLALIELESPGSLIAPEIF